MLLQLHHHFIDYSAKKDRFNFVAQNDINSNDEMRQWQKETAENFPLPEGACWYICNEKDRQFIMTGAET